MWNAKYGRASKKHGRIKIKIMEKEIFEKEITICKQLSKKGGGRCNWGECEKCGVIPLLYKLGKGEFYENKEDIERIKKIALQ
jgi:hypothetical protein